MKQLSLLLLVLCLFAFPSTASADIAPPYNPPGSNLQPGSEVTQVRMVAETVLIDVQDSGELGRARVTADFTMLNMGTEPESMAVRFPISANNGRFEYPEIAEIVIKLEGKKIPYRRASYPDPAYGQDDVPWAEFDVTFPPGKQVAIQVSYTLDGSGYYPYTSFYYILETGAGWKDTIGSADVILRMPYPVNLQNFVTETHIGWASTTSGGVINGDEVRWHFEDFEPGESEPVSDMSFVLASPMAWNAVLTEQDNTVKNPQDAEAWGRLGKAYKELFLLTKEYRGEPGGEELYRASVEAYERCLSINPNDAQWHAGLAELYAVRAYWDSWNGPTADVYLAMEEIDTALRLAPNDPVVLEIAELIHNLFPEGVSRLEETTYDFLWLTQTPTAAPISTPPALIVPTNTLAESPTAEPAPTTQPAPQSSSSPCGAAMLAPLAAVIWFARKRSL